MAAADPRFSTPLNMIGSAILGACLDRAAPRGEDEQRVHKAPALMASRKFHLDSKGFQPLESGIWNLEA